MIKHRFADLLHTAADHAHAKFSYDNGLNFWSIETVLCNPEHNWKYMTPFEWQREKEAFENGEIIQWRYKTKEEWKDTEKPVWSNACEYRIKGEHE